MSDRDGGRDADDRDVGEDAGARDADERDDGQPPADADPEDDSEWEFSLQDLEQREADAAAAEEAKRRRRQPLEAGDPSLENALFVLLGVVLTLFVISRMLVL